MKRRIALLAAACVAVMALGGCQKVNEAPTAPAVTQGEADAAKEEPAGKKAEEGKGVNKVASGTTARWISYTGGLRQGATKQESKSMWWRLRRGNMKRACRR